MADRPDPVRRRILGSAAALVLAPGLRLARAEAKRVEGSGEWKQLEAAWKEGEAVASGSRGQYPFDRAGRERLLAALAAAGSGLDALVKRSLLAQPAAELLKKDLALLAGRVREFRPTEMRGATCYEPMPLKVPARESLERLRERMPLLQRLAASDKLPRVALDKLLARVERDLGELEAEDKTKPLARAERAEAKKIVRELRVRLAALKARIPR
jgi:hypothetical protein